MRELKRQRFWNSEHPWYFCWKCQRIHYENTDIGHKHSNAENVLTIPPRMIDAIKEACMDRQMNIAELTKMYVEHGLKEDGLLEVVE